MTWKIDFERQILALFDTSPLHQFSKFDNFLLVCWFLGRNLSNFVPSAWKLDDPYYHNEDPQEEFCQNQEDTAFEDPFENSSQNLSEKNDLSLENFSTSASSSKNRRITKISSQVTGLEVD